MVEQVAIWVGIAASVVAILQWLTPLRPFQRIAAGVKWITSRGSSPATELPSAARPQGPPWQRYMSDTLFGLNCEWRWIGTDDVVPDVRLVLCPQCQNEIRWSRLLRVRGTTFDAVCDRCGFRKTTSIVDERPVEGVEREIRRLVRSGEWKKRIRSSDRAPHVAPTDFNPHEAGQELIRFLVGGLREQYEASGALRRGVSFSEHNGRNGVCLRFLLKSEIRYALDLSLGLPTSDDAVVFEYQRGDPSRGRLIAMGAVKWSTDKDEPVIPLTGFPGRAGHTGEYTYGALVRALWSDVCAALENSSVEQPS